VNILGLNRGDHDASACLVQDGHLKSFINVERLTRIKHDGGRIWQAVRYCLDTNNLDPDDIDIVVQNAYTHDVAAFDALYRSGGRLDGAAEFMSQFPNVLTISHHLAHAYCGVALSPFDQCVVMVLDGIGQQVGADHFEAQSYYRFENRRLQTIFQQSGTIKPDGLGFRSFESLGGIYSAVSSYLFGHWDHCGKVMALAPFGTDEGYNWSIVSENDGRLSFDFEFKKDLQHPPIAESDWLKNAQEYSNIAYLIQKQVEDALLSLTQWLHRETACSNLVIAGGLGLNCVANQRVVEQSPFTSVFVPPVCGDDGIAVGCAYYGWLAHHNRSKVFSLTHPYFGKKYSKAEITGALSTEPLVCYRPQAGIAFKAAELIAGGNLVGWFQGASEMGPRALGNRSILADPRDHKIKDLLNQKIKHRQPFQPFGASVMASHAADYLEVEAEAPFMTFAIRVKADKRQRIPAVVHGDDTCRIQTVRRQQNRRYYQLLQAFFEITGVPLVLNTSFNTRDEPMVETPQDALACFMSTDLDVLIIDNYLIEKTPLHHQRVAIPELLGFAIAARKQFDVVKHVYPGGTVTYSIHSLFPRKTEISEIDASHLQLIASADSGRCLGEVFQSAGIRQDSIEANEAIAFIQGLRIKGLIRFEIVKQKRYR